jgi:alkanesulfonate monooxygenase SsuD/methylene tetrahydromethanopterin reductase-like flavin-dependent oxidoreductase (luciferase family)
MIPLGRASSPTNGGGASMEVGVGLPTTTPGADGRCVLEWARRAERGPFASLGVLDRMVYRSVEPLTALAAAAAVTTRVRLVTMVVIGPLRNTALLAKQAASLDLLSGGRLTLGLAIGARADDYRALGIDRGGRGRRLGEQLAELRSIWEQAELGPEPAQPGGPPLLAGGLSGEAFARMARGADGYVHGGGPPRAFAGAAAKAWAAWRDLERPGRPQLWGQGYFALGDADAGGAYLRDYYAFTGPFAEKIAAGNLSSARAVKDFVRGYEEAGCDHLVLLPTVSDPAQLDRLADVLN